MSDAFREPERDPRADADYVVSVGLSVLWRLIKLGIIVVLLFLAIGAAMLVGGAMIATSYPDSWCNDGPPGVSPSNRGCFKDAGGVWRLGERGTDGRMRPKTGTVTFPGGI